MLFELFCSKKSVSCIVSKDSDVMCSSVRAPHKGNELNGVQSVILKYKATAVGFACLRNAWVGSTYLALLCALFQIAAADFVLGPPNLVLLYWKP